MCLLGSKLEKLWETSLSLRPISSSIPFLTLLLLFLTCLTLSVAFRSAFFTLLSSSDGCASTVWAGFWRNVHLLQNLVEHDWPVVELAACQSSAHLDSVGTTELSFRADNPQHPVECLFMVLHGPMLTLLKERLVGELLPDRFYFFKVGKRDTVLTKIFFTSSILRWRHHESASVALFIIGICDLVH